MFKEDDDFEFGGINTKVKMNEQDSLVKEILLHSVKSNTDKHLLILTEKKYTNAQLGALSTWLKKHLVGFSYDLVTATILDVSMEKIKKEGYYHHYKRARSDFSRYIIPDKTIVVTLGSALNAITLSSDLSVECFQDYIFNKTYFYSPQTDTYVFPLDGYMSLFQNEQGYWAPKDCSRVEFALYQIQQIKTFYGTLKETPPIRTPRIIELKTKEDWHDFYVQWKTPAVEMCWDTETDSLQSMTCRCGCFTCSFDGKTGYFIPWEIVNVEQLSILLSNKIQIGQNLKFDRKVIDKYGVKNTHIHHDTWALSHSINEMRFHSLKSLAYYYTPYGGYDNELEDYKDRFHPDNYLEIPVPILKKYATMDAIVNFLVYKSMIKQIDELDKKFPPTHENGWSMRRLYEDIVIPATNKFVEIEERGICVDMKVWERNALILMHLIEDCKSSIQKGLGITDEGVFQDLMDDDSDEEETKSVLQSTMKLGKILEAKGWEELGRAKNGVYLTGDEQLLRWINFGHAEAVDLQKLRSYLTLQKTFLGFPNSTTSGWKKNVQYHKEDNTYRIHPSYKVMLMDTFRSGCSDPNWQQIPSQALNAELFKQIFTVPDKEKYLQITNDMSSFQIRLCALDIGDVNDNLYRLLLSNPKADLHSITGYSIFADGVEYIFVNNEGKDYVYSPIQTIAIIRSGEPMYIQAKDLVETDILVTDQK